MRGDGVRIKDLGFIEGARANQLTGFGVVLGLNNTGDKDTVYSKQAIANLLQQYGLTNARHVSVLQKRRRGDGYRKPPSLCEERFPH